MYIDIEGFEVINSPLYLSMEGYRGIRSDYEGIWKINDI